MPGEIDHDEERRSQTVRRYAILDTPADREFDTIVSQAAAAVGTSMALVSIVDRNRQWFKARIGIAAAETPLASSFCTHAIRGPGVFCVADASRDARFAGNPLVVGRPNIRFYAGVPLQLDGVRVGTLCVLDDQPRQSLSTLHARYLTYLADRATAALKTSKPR